MMHEIYTTELLPFKYKHKKNGVITKKAHICANADQLRIS
uniref:Uncharacterized protein n=1 Tax=Escherichia coli TaxID=562 RepID=A0A2P9E1R1_ECOLX|nr:hypothetical protein RCS32TR557_P0029 [Escherichia coli]